MTRKATSTIKQQPVQVSTVDDTTYVYIYLNEKEVQREDASEDGTKSTQYEYDYNEICGKTADIDLERITKNPENYMNVSVIEPQKSETTSMPTLEERVTAIEEVVLATMGGNQ